MNNYHVRLAFTMNSETPSDAVQDVIDTFTEHGVRNLLYVVDEADTGVRVGFFNGWGEEIDSKEVEARAAQLRTAPASPDSAESELSSDLDDDPTGDAELEHLAESLNRPSSIQGFPISPGAEVTEMPAGSGWQWLVKDGDTYWGVNEDPGDQVFIDQSDYERDLQAAHIPEG